MEKTAVKKWNGTEFFRAATAAISEITKEMPNLTYRELEQVISCINDLAKENAIFPPA